MKKKFILLFVLPYYLSFSQGILEYNKEFLANFHIYDSIESIYYKIDEAEINRKTPEGLVQSYFFANNDNWEKENYLESSDVKLKRNTHYENIKKMDKSSNYIRLQHKFTYNIEGMEICYIMFVAELQGIDFKFPTILSCVKNNDQWFIYNLPNQQELLDIIWTFKSCKIMQLLKGEMVGDDLTSNLIKLTRNVNFNLSISKLYKESNKWEQNGVEQQHFMMTENNSCKDFEEKSVTKNVEITANYKKVNLKIIKKEDQYLYSDVIIKINDNGIKDSILISSILNIEYNSKKYSIVKYLKNNVPKIKILTELENKFPNPVNELFFIFEKIKSDFLFDLSFSNSIEQHNNDNNFKNIYKATRGQYNSLNTTKLYNLLKNQKQLFLNYIEN